METKNLTATATTVIDAPVEKIWEAFVNPEIIKKYMFGTTVISDWKVGSDIVWKGEWNGKPYQDEGKIVALEPLKKIEYSHYSPLMDADVPENHHLIAIALEPSGEKTRVILTQDKNKTEEANAKSAKNWQMMLDALKKLLESD